MDKLCLLFGWSVARSVLILLEDLDDDLAFNYFVSINGLTFFVHTIDATISSLTYENPANIPEPILHGFSLAGGSPGASLAMVLLQNKRHYHKYNLTHMTICVAQSLMLMSMIKFKHGCSIEVQLSETMDELRYTFNMIWNNLLSRFSWNSQKHKHPHHSAARFLNVLLDHFK
ncbi:uncharacterized protein LOC120336316 isoform X1 [Styela clava]